MITYCDSKCKKQDVNLTLIRRSRRLGHPLNALSTLNLRSVSSGIYAFVKCVQVVQHEHSSKTRISCPKVF